MPVMEITVPTILSDSAKAAITFLLIKWNTTFQSHYYYNLKICINCVYFKYFNKIKHKNQ